MLRAAALLMGISLLAAPAHAIMGTDESALPSSSDPDFAAGLAAYEREDWRALIGHMAAVLEGRPWHDDAQALTGYAYRKLGDYDRSLAHYDRALALNPHNMNALEYLGEAYLELDRPEDAAALLARLEDVCRRLPQFADGGWREGCEPWRELKAAYDDHVRAAE